MHHMYARRETIGTAARRRLRDVVRKKERCPVCDGLECQCRPRFFAGQLLTDQELTAAQDYVIKKNRLHNRYLHGSGVVCGMTVVCHPKCKGWVRVEEGYAIGPCGDDIVVCEPADFDVLEAVKTCLARKRPLDDECAPWVSESPDCAEDGCWYLTIEYAEFPTRPVTAFDDPKRGSSCDEPCGGSTACDCAGPSSGSESCGCGGSASYGCSGNGHGPHNGTHTTNGHSHGGGASGCGCAGGSHAPTRAACGPGAAPPRNGFAPGPRPIVCEPSRVCEGFRLTVRKASDERPTYEDLLGDTLLGRVVRCIREASELARKAPIGRREEDRKLYQAYCLWLREVEAFFESHPVTHCDVFAKLAKLRLPKPDEREYRGMVETGAWEYAGGYGYSSLVDERVEQVTALLAAYIRECICLALLPPCPTDTGETDLILACVTIEDGRIVDICNWQGRKLVWTWPTIRYWLSALPIEAGLMRLIELVCCGRLGVEIGDVLVRSHKYPAAESVDGEAVDDRNLFESLRLWASTMVSGWDQ